MRGRLITVIALLGLGLGGCEREHSAPPPPRPAARSVASPDLLPLPQVLAAAARVAPGEVVRVELEGEDERRVYEVEILAANGRLIEVKIDARTGAVLKREAD